MRAVLGPRVLQWLHPGTESEGSPTQCPQQGDTQVAPRETSPEGADTCSWKGGVGLLDESQVSR